MEYYNHKYRFDLESGASLPEITIAYKTFGHLNSDKSKVVLICHALTANADGCDWWPGVVGEGCVINPTDHFIVCANILASCYGSTGPLSINPSTEKPYYDSFPLITIRDMVKAHILLRQHLNLPHIHLLVGGSLGGYQALEWAVLEQQLIRQLFLLATSPAESAFGIAVHTAQRLAIEADATWLTHQPNAGNKGLKAARAVGMLTYRNYGILVQKQTDTDTEKLDQFKASSYINYQGDKLVNRFNAYSYWQLTKSMDTHHLGRGRGGKIETVLAAIDIPTLIIGINSDILCPLQEQQFMAKHLPHATLVEIDSVYGHDGFMVESEKISAALKQWQAQTIF